MLYYSFVFMKNNGNLYQLIYTIILYVEIIFKLKFVLI